MKARLKIIMYFILELILSIILFMIVGLVLMKVTIYNSNFIKKELDKNNYYEELENNINTELSNYLVQSGLEEDVISSLIDQNTLKDNINNIIDSIYEGKEIEVNSDNFREELINNIYEYLESYNIEIEDEESFNTLIDKLVSIYEDEITISSITEKIENIINKTKSLINIGIIITIIIFMILFILIKLLFKQNIMAIPLYTVGLLLIILNIYINNNITVSNIYVWDSNVSNIIQSMMLDIFNIIKISGVISIILGLLDNIANIKRYRS